MPTKAKAVAAAAEASLISEDERIRFRSIVAEDVKVAHRWAQFAASMATRLLFQPWSKALADPLREEVKAVVADNPDYNKDGRPDAHKIDTYASSEFSACVFCVFLWILSVFTRRLPRRIHTHRPRRRGQPCQEVLRRRLRAQPAR